MYQKLKISKLRILFARLLSFPFPYIREPKRTNATNKWIFRLLKLDLQEYHGIILSFDELLTTSAHQYDGYIELISLQDILRNETFLKYFNKKDGLKSLFYQNRKLTAYVNCNRNDLRVFRKAFSQKPFIRYTFGMAFHDYEHTFFKKSELTEFVKNTPEYTYLCRALQKEKDTLASAIAASAVVGALSGAMTGAIAGTDAGKVAGYAAGTASGTIAGAAAGSVAGEAAGSVAGEAAGAIAGNIAGATVATAVANTIVEKAAQPPPMPLRTLLEKLEKIKSEQTNYYRKRDFCVLIQVIKALPGTTGQTIAEHCKLDDQSHVSASYNRAINIANEYGIPRKDIFCYFPRKRLPKTEWTD